MTEDAELQQGTQGKSFQFETDKRNQNTKFSSLINIFSIFHTSAKTTTLSKSDSGSFQHYPNHKNNYQTDTTNKSVISLQTFSRISFIFRRHQSRTLNYSGSYHLKKSSSSSSFSLSPFSRQRIHPISTTSISSSSIDNLSSSASISEAFAQIPRNNYGNLIEKGKFEVLSGLGIGGFSTVVKVKNVYNNKTYAMKVISKKKIVQIQLMVELDIMKSEKLNQSLFLQKCYYSFESNNNVFFVLDLYEGKDLFYHLIENKKATLKDGFQEDKVKLILAELYLAISHLHACGYIHRDLKMENIMVNHDGHIKLIDFGLAVEFKHQIQPMSAMGSLVYMAPELIRDKTGGRHTDWWSYGVLAHELNTGRSPWSTYDNVGIIKKEILSRPIEIRKSKACSLKMVNFLLSLLTRNVELRQGFHHDDEVKNHKFFKGIDWSKTAKLSTEPPFLCYLRTDTYNLDQPHQEHSHTGVTEWNPTNQFDITPTNLETESGMDEDQFEALISYYDMIQVDLPFIRNKENDDENKSDENDESKFNENCENTFILKKEINSENMNEDNFWNFNFDKAAKFL